MDELTREFLIESQEGLDRMERCLTDLEEHPQDKELLGEIFRSVHTMKGTTGFLGFQRLEKLAHAGENLLGLLRDGKLLADGAIITGLLQLLDALRGILKSIELENSEGIGEDVELVELLHTLQHPESVQVEAYAATNAATPDAKRIVQTNRPSPPAILESDTAPPPSSKSSPESRPAASESTIRVDVVVLNRLMNLVGELVLTRNQIMQAAAHQPGLTLLSRRLDTVTADLRESVVRVRMQPISNVFSKFPRIIRDLSQALQRRVRLVIEGQETELDKSLLEAIKDPLIHAVRNSLDHGIESPETRIAIGKDPEGTLKLRAYRESGCVLIEVSDDGAGIRVDRVLAKAIERGLISAAQAARLSEQELLQLILLPGFSTAEAVTNISGRGVGMDVVRANVEKIGGKVEIDSRPGKGATLRLRIPLTLTIIPALIVRSLNQSFALPQSALSELIHIPPERASSAIEWMEGVSLYRVRGQLLPLLFLDCVLSPGQVASARQAEISSRRDNFIAILDADGRRFGLVVDGLADLEEIVVKPLSPILKAIGLYSGTTVLGNGDLALILDPGLIAARAGVAIRVPEEPASQSPEEKAADSQDYLVFETGGRRAAVPLEEVVRIEHVPISRIEFIGFSPVINFAGQLLPVEDFGGVLPGAGANPEMPLTVIVCRQGVRHVGIAVSQVVDIAAGSSLVEAGSRDRADGVTLLKDQVTSIVDIRALPSLQPASQPASQLASQPASQLALHLALQSGPQGSGFEQMEWNSETIA